jgi:ABC-type branched-subunit amino acid transport system ATPase component/ABC-type branched-subunit amino acid transport system permease subunit
MSDDGAALSQPVLPRESSVKQTGPAVPVLVSLAVVALAVAFPLLVASEYRIFVATQVGTYLLVAMGLNLLTGYGGQTSLGQGAIMAIGAYATAILTVSAGWPFWSAALVSVLLVCVVGALMALPAFRISHWYLALVTFGFAGVVNGMLVEWSDLTGGFGGIVGIPMPSLFGHAFTSRDLFWLVAGIDIAVFLMIRNLIMSRFGRGLIAVRDNPLAAVASGVPLVGIKLSAFVVSAAMAGLAGAIFAVQKTVITPDDFTAELSIFFLLVIILGGAGSLWGPVIGTVAFFVIPELMTGLASWRMLVYGIGLLLLMIYAPKGLEGALRSLLRTIPSVRRTKALAASPVTTRSLRLATAARRSSGLEVRGLVKRFGGVTALDHVTVTVAPGSCHAVVGPNGSGKTTLLNLIAGYYKVSEGTVALDGVDVTNWSASRLAGSGIGRTFQTPKLLPDMSVLDNVMLGGYAAEKAWGVEIALHLPRARREEEQARKEALEILGFVGLLERAYDRAGDVPHGQQRLIEIARALVGRPQLLLLDEPAAGLSMDELSRLEALVRSIQESGISLVIVEHHLDLVASLSDHVTVIDRGKVIASGTARHVFSDENVMRAYMGSTAVLTHPDANEDALS